MNMIKTTFLFFCFNLFIFSAKSQAILNTETLMKEIDSTIFFSGNLEGDLQFGNINLLQFNGSTLFGKKIKKHLFRGFINYGYLAENNSILSSDLSSQFRYNYEINNHSFFGFFQIQNAISLKLNKRIVLGGGFRQGLLKKKNKGNYFDMAYGVFLEDEEYQESMTTMVNVTNIRINLASYSQFQIGKKNRLLTVLYYQLNAENFADYRIYVEPRFYHDWKKISMYIKGMYRFHSTPYIDIINFDSDFMMGFEFKL